MDLLKMIVPLALVTLWAPVSFAETTDPEVFETTQPASEPVTAATPTWGGEAEAGLVATSGNTTSRSTNMKLTVKRTSRRWEHRLSAEYIAVSNASQTTAERTAGAFESHYLLSERDYFFGAARSAADRFSGYDRQFSETAGYGRRFDLSHRSTLEAEAGAGGRQARLSDGSHQSDAILRLAARFRYALGETSEFKEDAFSEIASDNRHTESVTSVSSRINDSLSLKAAYTVLHNSLAPARAKSTDTVTSVMLVFDL